MSIQVSARTRWNFVAASQRGLTHERRGEKCQDACTAFHRGPALYLALADGAGSALFGGLGAMTAVEASRSWLQEQCPSPTDPNWPDMLRSGVREIHASLQTVACSKGLSMDDLACTLLLAIVTPTGAIAAHLGDGGAVLMRSDGELRMLSVCQREGAANRTAFVTDVDWEPNLGLALQRGEFTGLAAFSDGLEAGAVNGQREPHPGFFQPLFAACSQHPVAAATKDLREFLRSDHLRAHTDDDCTLIIASLRRSTP